MASPSKSSGTRYSLWARVGPLAENPPATTNNNAQESVAPTANNNNYTGDNVPAEGVVTTEATTTFVADANVVSASPHRAISIDQLLMESSSSNFYQDIKTFLAKPIRLTAGSLSTTDVVSVPLYVANLPQDIFRASAMMNDKAKGFIGFRATMKIRWQVNGNKFQQGRYFLNYVPTGGGDYTKAMIKAAVDSNNNTLTSRTQTFHAEIDVSCDTEANLTIPFVSTMNYVPNVTGGINYFGMLGVLGLWAYSPLVAATGSTVASYTIWASFDNVELIGPAHPQSSRANFSSWKGKSQSEQEKGEAMGPIQSGLMKVSNLASLFVTVPLISDYAKGTAWLTDKLSGAASVFGWSRPNNTGIVPRMTRESTPWFCNVDAPDQSQHLSLSYKNSVGLMPGFSGTDIDEMDFSFFKTIPAWHATVTWSTAAIPGAVITSIYNGAMQNVLSRTVGAATIYDFKPYEFLCSQFAYWRGSLVYTFKFVKTEFHSGRLCFAFFPQDNYASGAAGSYALSPYVHNEVIDIRDCNEVTFVIPYISSSPWRPTSLTASQTQLGEFNVYVVDPLVAPSSVSSSISIILEISAGPDFEVSVPKGNAFIPIVDMVPQSGSSDFSGFKPQRNDCELVSGTLGSASVKPDQGINALACIGESVSSWRTMLKMPNLIPPRDGFGASQNFLNMVPFAVPVAQYIGPGVFATPVNSVDLYGVLSSMYALSRGSVRIKLVSVTTAAPDTAPSTYLYAAGVASDMTSSVIVSFGATDWQATATYKNRLNSLQLFYNNKANGVCEFEVPQYHKWHSRVNAAHTLGPAGRDYGSNVLATAVGITHYYNNSTNGGLSIISRSLGDDGNFGLFVSVPPLTPTRTIALQN